MRAPLAALSLGLVLGACSAHEASVEVPDANVTEKARLPEPPIAPSRATAIVASAEKLAKPAPDLSRTLAEASSLSLLGPGSEALGSAGRTAPGRALGVVAPKRADGPMSFGLGASEAHAVSLTLEGARATTVEVVDGRAVYADALPSTDAVVVAQTTHFEQLLVMRDANAPRTVRYRVALGGELGAPRVDADGVTFTTKAGHDAVHMPAPYAVDAKGTHVATTWSLVEGVLSIALPADLVYPVLLDPAGDIVVWSKSGATPPGGAGVGRRSGTMSFDSARNVSVFFGGLDSGSVANNDVWEWNGTAWTQRCTGAPCSTVVPTGRSQVASAYGSLAKVLVFGGLDSANVGDTWSWDGAANAWTKLCNSGSCGLTARRDSAMAYDSFRNEYVLFGGNAGVTKDETFVWDNPTKQWIAKCTGACTRPSARQGAAMAYDSKRKKVVLFGGYDPATATFYSDTWEWDGATTTWASVGGATHPTGRYDAAMGYDPYRGVSVLFGGGNTALATYYADTWEWDGTSWKSLSPGTAPTARYGVAGAFDTNRRRFVAYGGGAPSPIVPGETWEYMAYAGVCSTGADCDTGVCEDSVCCQTACGTCQRCNAGGSVGTCTSLTNIEDTAGVPCSGTSYCNGAGACVAKLAKGATCSTTAGGDTSCATGHCVSEGSSAVCCDTTCTGGCASCLGAATGGANGTCASVTAGAARGGGLTTALCGSASAPGTCGNDGTCDGSGGCRKWISTTVCVAASCASATTEKKTSYCSGSGTCGTTAATACAAGYACVGTACKTSCGADSDCATGYYCSGSACVLKKVGGSACTAANQCASGFCPAEDSVCCDVACNGKCEGCLAAKTGVADGTCAAIKDGGDPDSECPDPPLYACTSASGMGVCDGARACRAFAKAGTVCATGTTCTAGEQTGKACDGAGNCKAGTVTKCEPYKCDSAGVACLSKCTAASDCTDEKLYYCDALGLCQPRKALGTACTDEKECAVGNKCAEGVCCDTACTGQCESCLEAATKGTCTAVTGDPRGGRTACGGEKGSVCAGKCDGTNRSSCFYDVGKECDAKCAASKATISKCDGTGACKAEPDAACNGYKCTADSKRCGTDCKTGDDCETGYRCDASKCVPVVAKCSADGTSVEDGTKTTSCLTYKCRGGKCLDKCSTSDDCVTPNLCDGDKCVAPTTTPPVPPEEGGCGCAVPRTTNDLGFGVGVLFAATLVLRRRRK